MPRIAALIFLFFTATVFPVFSQQISGFVKDSDGNALPHASIMVEGTGLGTVTDARGFYSLQLNPSKYKITVSFLGYVTIHDNIQVLKNKNTTKDYVLQPVEFVTAEVEINAKQNDGFNKIDAPVRVRTIDAADIRIMPASGTSKLLDKVSGVDVKSDFGIFSSQTVVSLRGLGGSKQTGTLVVIDGSPVNKSESGSVNWNMINKDEIEKIEIMKGPGSVMFGSNAMGGVINITTRKPRSLLAADVQLAYGRYNTFESGLHASGRSKNNLAYWKFNAGYRRSDGYVNTPDYLIAENDTIVAPVFLREYNLGSVFGFHLDEASRLEFSVNYYDDQRGTGIKIFENMGGFDEHDTFHSYIKYRGLFRKVSVFANVYFMNEFYSKLNEYYSDGEYKLYEIDSKRFDYGTKAWTEFNMFKKLETTTGFEIKTGSVNGKDIYFTSTDIISNRGKMSTMAGFLQLKWKFATPWMVYGGLRYDHAFFYDAAFSIDYPSYSIEYLSEFQFSNVENKMWNAVNPKLTLQYAHEDKVRWYFSAAGGFGAPILEDLCRTGRKKIGFKVANPNLKPEQITNIETGGDLLLFEKLNLSASIFYTMGRDFMYFITTGDSVNLGYTIVPVYQVDNISKVEIYGFESDASLKMGKGIRLFANYTYTHSQIKDYQTNTPGADKDLTGKFLTDMPMHKFSAGFSFENKYVNFSASTKYTGKRWINDENKIDYTYLLTDRYPAYWLVDLKLWRQFKSFTCSVDVENLLNTVFTDSKGYSSPGIFYMLSVKYSLNKN